VITIKKVVVLRFPPLFNQKQRFFIPVIIVTEILNRYCFSSGERPDGKGFKQPGLLFHCYSLTPLILLNENIPHVMVGVCLLDACRSTWIDLEEVTLRATGLITRHGDGWVMIDT